MRFLPTSARLLLLRWTRPFWAKPTLGQRGEAAAARFLKRKGYRIVARGEREGRSEIDIVAVDRRTVVFVEVKTLSSDSGGHPAEKVTAEKERALVRGAKAFLKRHDLLEHAARFDLVSVIWTGRKPKIEHIENAFQPSDQGQMFS